MICMSFGIFLNYTLRALTVCPLLVETFIHFMQKLPATEILHFLSYSHWLLILEIFSNFGTGLLGIAVRVAFL